jgi:hypothetical protein
MRDLTRGLLARIKRLEASLPAAPAPTFWDWWLGGADPELLQGADRELYEELQTIENAPPGDGRNDIDFQLEALEALAPVADAQEPAPVPGRLLAGLRELTNGEGRTTADEAERP